VISAQRENLLEHALSWCIYVVSRNLNVYSAQDKFHHFARVYQDRITVDRTNLLRYLDTYVEYLDWVNRHFHVNSYFVYDQHIGNLEKYILDLPVFNTQKKKITWQDSFDIEFADWNRCHYLCSDMSGISTQIDPEQLQIGYNDRRGLENIELAPVPQLTVSDVIKSLGTADRQFLHANGVRYKRSSQHLQELVDNKILVTGVPIKLQTMMEKRLLVRNFAETVGWYNEWVERSGVGQPYTEAALLESAAKEIREYHAVGLELSQQKDDAPHESLHLTNDPPQG
jgi:acetone carboxylase gamma subunit